MYSQSEVCRWPVAILILHSLQPPRQKTTYKTATQRKKYVYATVVINCVESEIVQFCLKSEVEAKRPLRQLKRP